MRLCSGCRGAHYCSQACQKAAWPAHKLRCKLTGEKLGAIYASPRAPSKEVTVDTPVIQELDNLPQEQRKIYLAGSFADASKLDILLYIGEFIFLNSAEYVTIALHAAADRVSTSRDVLGGPEFKQKLKAASINRAIYLRSVQGHTLLSLALACGFQHLESPESRSEGLRVLKTVLDATPPAEVRKPLSGDGICDRPMSALEFTINSSFRASPGDTGVEDQLRLLLSRGGFPRGGKALSDGLFAAVRSSPASVVKHLLEAGADAKSVDGSRFNALHVISDVETMDTREKVQLLVAAGTPLEATNKDGVTPLLRSLVSVTGSNSAFRALLDAGANPRVLGSVGRNGMGIGVPLLHHLAGRGDVASIRSVLDPSIVPRGIVKVNSVDATGKTALHLAAVHFRFGGECVQALIEAGADVFATEANGSSALFVAAVAGSYRSAKALIKAGALQRTDSSTIAEHIMSIQILASTGQAATLSSTSGSQNKVTPAEVMDGWRRITEMLERHAT